MADIIPARGRVYWADLGGSIGRRPWIVISENVRNRNLLNVTAVMMTTTRKDLPNWVEMGPQDPVPGFANCEHVETVHRDEISADAGALTRETMRRVEEAFKRAHCLD
ncbi:type II toxin-antitoxin system PemK/MazF family toxin [Streptomyces sp. NPDC000927]|uniref:type II toxin-antitoxin system PemK/MazF family toxin n=1 Tax=Streptomyces sp. NPDC000927 TaxID=3154371 RepID=UPI00332C454D